MPSPFRSWRKRGLLIPGTKRAFAALPMPGEFIESHTPSEFYPWAFSRDLTAALKGGYAIKWWRRLRAGTVTGSMTVTDTDPAGFGTITIAAAVPMLRNPTVFDDERDTKSPDCYTWAFAGTVGTSRLTGQMGICGPAGATPTFANNAPGPSYYLLAESLAPQFWVRAVFEHTVHVGFNGGQACSYGFTNLAASSSIGAGTMDGQAFDLQVQPVIPTTGSYQWNITACSLAVTMGTAGDFYSRNGKYDTATGDYAAGVTTNQYGPP